LGPFCSYLPTTIHKYLIWIKCNICCLVEICHFPLFDFWKTPFLTNFVHGNGIGLLKRKTPPCLYSYRLSLWKRFWSSANYLWYFMIRNSPFLGSNRQNPNLHQKIWKVNLDGKKMMNFFTLHRAKKVGLDLSHSS